MSDNQQYVVPYGTPQVRVRDYLLPSGAEERKRVFELEGRSKDMLLDLLVYCKGMAVLTMLIPDFACYQRVRITVEDITDSIEENKPEVTRCEAWRSENGEIVLDEKAGFRRCGRAPDSVTNGRMFRLCAECAMRVGYGGKP